MTPDKLAKTLELLLVTDDRMGRSTGWIETCHSAIRGGVTAVQLRSSVLSDRERLELARAMVSQLPVPIFVNDRLDIALIAGAAGVHLGADDLAPDQARHPTPSEFVIGASVGTDEEAVRGQAADYWGVGPLRVSPTKPGAGPPLGIEGVARLIDQNSDRPVVAIGGVRPEDLIALRTIGCSGVAVSSGILGTTDSEEAARSFRNAIA
jgi:thiamine-phosphate pyrophosphorylase